MAEEERRMQQQGEGGPTLVHRQNSFQRMAFIIFICQFLIHKSIGNRADYVGALFMAAPAKMEMGIHSEPQQQH